MAFGQYSEEQEFEFANKLIDMGFMDYARKVIGNLGGSQDSLQALFDGRLLLNTGKFDEAESAFKKAEDGAPKYRMLMRLGDVHWTAGRTEKCAEVYEYVFSRYKDVPTEASARQFYLESAYKFFKLMQRVDNTDGAIKALERVSAANTNEFVKRQVNVDLANLKVDKAEGVKDKKRRAAILKDVRQICDKTLFMIPDKFFGDAVSVLVRVELLDNNYDRALSLINEYTPMVQSIEKAIVDSGDPNAMMFSPMAALRFQKGGIYSDLAKEGEKAKDGKKLQQNLVRSYTEYLNTFYKYKESEWGADAVPKLFEISDWAKKYQMNLAPKGGRAAIFSLMVESADSLYARKQYKAAKEAYEKTLKLFPVENERTATILKNLAYCYINGQNNGELTPEDDFSDLMPEAIAGLLADRFRGNNEAGNSIYKIGGHYLTNGQEDINQRIWLKFTDGFPDDPRSAGVLFLMGEKARKDWKENRTPGQREKALYYYQRVGGNDLFKDDIHYLKSLDRVAGDYLEAKEYAKALPFYNKIRKEASPGMDQAIAQFKLANCLFSMEKYPNCLAFLEDLEKRMNDPKAGAVFQLPLNVMKSRKLREEVLFRIAATNLKMAEVEDDGRSTKIWEATKANIAAGQDKDAAGDKAAKQFPPSAKTAGFWQAALEGWDKQLLDFGRINKKDETGNLAPMALEGQGRIYMQRGTEADIKLALEKYERIGKRFPESPQAERVYYYLVREGLKLGREDIVDRYVNGMTQNASNYSAGQLLQVGQLLVDKEKFKEGRDVLKVAASHKDAQGNKSMEQRILKALVVSSNRSGDFKACVGAGESMLEKYPKTPYKFDIYREMANAHRQLKNCDDAVQSIRWVFQFAKDAKDPGLEKFRANLALARIEKECGKADDAIQSYWRLTLRPAPTVDQEAVAKEALAEGAAFSAQQGEFNKCLAICTKYLTWFAPAAGEERSKEYTQVLNYAKAAKERLDTP